jgi:hypothetical protein
VSGWKIDDETYTLSEISSEIRKRNSNIATNLVEMANGDMETVYKELARSGADPKDILKLREASDLRPTEKIANDHLSAIEANTSREMVEGQKTITGKTAGQQVTAASDESLKLAKSYKNLITMFDDPRLATVLGQAANVAGSMKPISTGLLSLSTGIPGLEDALKGLDATITALGDVSIIGNTVTPEIDGTTKKKNNDALLMNDGVVQFNKADKFMKVSDSTMIAGTNVDGNKKLARAITTGGGASIDYNQMASAIVSAMKSATFVATVKPDLLFNGKKY